MRQIEIVLVCNIECCFADGYTTCEAAGKEDWEDKKHLVTVVRGPDKRKYTFLRDILTLQRRVRVSKTMIQLVRNMSCRTFDLDIRDPEKQYIRPVITWTCKLIFFLSSLVFKLQFLNYGLQTVGAKRGHRVPLRACDEPRIRRRAFIN